jgi:hypothetical protein
LFLGAGEAYLLVMEAGGLELRDVSLKIKHNATQTTTQETKHMLINSAAADVIAQLATAEIATEAQHGDANFSALQDSDPRTDGLRRGFTLEKNMASVNQRDAVSADLTGAVIEVLVEKRMHSRLLADLGCSMEDVLHAAPDVLRDRSFIMSVRVPDSLDSASPPTIVMASGCFVVTVKKQANK